MLGVAFLVRDFHASLVAQSQKWRHQAAALGIANRLLESCRS
jgi:hypothetical protein